MPLPTYYNTGLASIANGATTVTFTDALLGSAEFPTIIAGDLFTDPAQPLVPPQRIASIDYAAGTAELAVAWPGTTMVAAPYEVRLAGDVGRSTAQTRRYLERLGELAALGIQPNAYGDFADRASFDGEKGGFIFLSLDGDGTTGVWTLYIKQSDTNADWDSGQSIEGPQGLQGAPGLIGNWRGAWVAGTYNELDVVERGGSSYIVKQGVASTIQEPPGSDWDVVAAQGADGTNGADGADGAPGANGAGVPAGGTIGQVAKKASNADFDVIWDDETGGGGSVQSVVAGDNIAVDETDPANPVVAGLHWPEVLRSTNRMPRGSFIRGVDGWGTNFSTDGAIAIFGFDPSSTQPSNLAAYFNRSKVQLGCNVTAKSASVGSPRRLPVDPTKKHKVTIAAMGYGTVNPLPSSIQVHCFNKSGQFLSTLTVNIDVVLSPTLPNGYYHAVINELGGSAPAFPAGTVSALPQVGYASTASQGLQVYMMAMIPEDELPCAIGTAIANNGGGSHEAVSDGTNLYIISHGMNEVAKMDGDLKNLATLAIGDYPHDIVVVGTDLWVCNHDAANLQRIALSTFTVSNTYAITGSKNGFGLGTDGTRLWLAAGTNVQGSALYEVNVATGAQSLLSTDLNTGAANLPIRFLAGSLWTIHEGNSQVKRINPTGGATIATINCAIGEIYGLGSGNGYVFACGTDGVAVVDPATNTVVQTHRFRLLNRGMSNVEVSGRYAFACASNGVMVVDVARNKSRETLLEGGDCKWARALPDGRVVVGAYAAPWMFVLG